MNPLPRPTFMKHFLLFPALLLGAGLSAAEIKTDAARVSQVTVYADRAEVVRHLRLRLEPGEHTLVFDQLPATTDLGQVRVDGSGAFTLVDIRTETVQLREAADAQVRKLQAALKELEVRTQALTQAEGRLAFQKGALDKVLTRLTATGKESANPEMDPAKWAAYLEFHAQQLAEIDQATLARQKEREQVRLESDRLNRELDELRGSQRRSRHLAKVNVSVREAGEAEFDLSYLVRGAGWTPSYDMRASTKTRTLAVTYHAQVRQSTGEDWRGVSLRLSTAQPGIAGREPKLDPWFISRLDDRRFKSPERKATEEGEAMSQMHNAFEADFADFGKSRTRSAKVTVGATAATYAIERPADILSDNKPTKVSVAQLSFPSVFRHTCVPKLSPHVYLKTKAVNESDFTLLPGETSVFLDGAFVATASLDLVPAGQDFWTYLGADQSVTVERKVLNRRSETSGVFGQKTARTVFDQVFKVTNGKNAEVDLVLWDQVPIADHEDIKVVIEEPAYAKDTDGLKMNESKFLEWRLPLKAGEKKDVPFRFAVEHPEGMPVAGL
ncbi:MAG: hypothetical protein RIS38_935 [Verrucomicrobiota bacterium]